MSTTTFYDVVRDWENGLEPYKGGSLLPREAFAQRMIARLGATPWAAEMSRFFSLKVRSEFLLKVIAVAVFWFFFAVLPPLNTGEENGFYRYNFFTDTIEYVETGIVER